MLCTNCCKDTTFQRLDRLETFTIKGQPIALNVFYLKCSICGDEILDPAQDPFEIAYAKYKQVNGI
jgi:YgiT-type zinc finger domain-containing protein